MKTQIQYLQTDGGEGIALIEGATASLDQAKLSLANKLDLPNAGAQENVDVRLRNGGIEPDSVNFSQVAE